MYVKVTVRKHKGEPTITFPLDLPADIRDYTNDTVNDVVSDHLDSIGMEYVWYRVNQI